METSEDGLVKGFVVYEDEKEDNKGGDKMMTTKEEKNEDQPELKPDEIETRFKGKVLKEFMPGILLE